MTVVPNVGPHDMGPRETRRGFLTPKAPQWWLWETEEGLSRSTVERKVPAKTPARGLATELSYLLLVALSQGGDAGAQLMRHTHQGRG